jgi:anti-anti-sigma factor
VALYRVYSRRLGRAYGAAARPDFIAALAAMLGVLVLDTLPGLFVGIAVSLLLLLYRASRPRIAVLGRVPGSDGQFADIDGHPENVEVDGVKVLRVESGLFFANADTVRARVREAAAPGIRAIVLDGEASPFVDVTAARRLADLHDDLRRDGVRLLLTRNVGQVRDVLRLTSGDPSAIHVHPTVEEALRAVAGDGE